MGTRRITTSEQVWNVARKTDHDELNRAQGYDKTATSPSVGYTADGWSPDMAIGIHLIPHYDKAHVDKLARFRYKSDTDRFAMYTIVVTWSKIGTQQIVCSNLVIYQDVPMCNLNTTYSV